MKIKNFKSNNSRRSQAALEFLTTYAWAFLVILIMIGALAYFGILAPGKILPDRCTFNVGFGCEAYTIGSDGTLNLKLKNNLGLITVTGIELSTDSSAAFTCLSAPSNPTNWAIGDIVELSWSECNAADVGFIPDDRGKVYVKITYYDVKAGLTYKGTAQGEVFKTVS